MKAVAAEFDLRVRGVAARAEGDQREGLPTAGRWWCAAPSPSRGAGCRWPCATWPRGRVLATLGREVDEGALRQAGADAGLRVRDLRRFALPRSGAQRAVAAFRRRR